MFLFGTAAEASRQPIVGAHNGLQRLTQIMACHRQQHAMEVVRLLKFALIDGLGRSMQLCRIRSRGTPLDLTMQPSLDPRPVGIVQLGDCGQKARFRAFVQILLDAPSRIATESVYLDRAASRSVMDPEAAACFGEVGLAFRTKFTDASATHILLDLPRP